MFIKVLAFDIWADFGYFRKFYTTTSPLTFSFPPPPTIAGILGSIFGTDKYSNEHLKHFNQCRIGLRIINPTQKIRIGINLAETKGKNIIIPMIEKNPRTQIRTEFLKNPKFRIYVGIEKENETFKTLVQRIKQHESVYTVSMGISELLANFSYVSLFEAELFSNSNLIDLSSPILASNLLTNDLELEQGKKYFKEKMPIIMNQERIVEKYEDVIFEPDGKTIRARVKTYCRLSDGENVSFF